MTIQPSTEFFEVLLDSGVQVVGQNMPSVESCAIGILVGAGARDEVTGQAGLSHFVEQMLFRGTEHLTDRQLLEQLDSLGISYDSSAGIEMTMVSAVLLGSRVPAALDLLADVIRFPAFPGDAVENVRQLQLLEIRQREDSPAQKVMDLLRRRMFAENPVGNDVLGSEDTVGTISREDLLSFWTDRYTANNMVISLAGNFDRDAVVEQLSRITANWPQGTGRLVTHEPEARTGVEALNRDTAQENIGLAFPAVAVADPHYYAVGLLSQAMGGSSTSRLFREVREKRGLAYAVQSRFDALEKTGLCRIYVGTSAERAQESVQVVMDELRKLEASGLTEDELNLSKTRLKSQLLMRSESTSARMVANARSWWFEQKLRTLENIRELVDHVTIDEISALLRELKITNNLTAVAVGPRNEQELFGGILAEAR